MKINELMRKLSTKISMRTDRNLFMQLECEYIQRTSSKEVNVHICKYIFVYMYVYI